MESHLLKPKVLPTSYGTVSVSPRKEIGDSDFSTSGTPKAVLIQASLHVEDAIEGIYTAQGKTRQMGTKDTMTQDKKYMMCANLRLGHFPCF
jgi:hypothetical protein